MENKKQERKAEMKPIKCYNGRAGIPFPRPSKPPDVCVCVFFSFFHIEKQTASVLQALLDAAGTSSLLPSL